MRRAGPGAAALAGLLLMLPCGGTAIAATPAPPPAAAPTAAAAPGTVVRKDTLRATPAVTAKAVGTVASGAPVSLGERRGFWQRVDSGGLRGWLRLASIRARGGSSGGAGLAALATGRGLGGAVSSTAARGLSATDLTGATPDPAALARVEALAVGEDEARRFSTEAGLVPQSSPYLKPGRKP